MLTYEKARAHIEYERLMAEIRMLRLGLTYDVKSDKLEERYTGQPRNKNGQFDFGKARLTKAERIKVSSGIMTGHPKLKPGNKSYEYEYGDYIYEFSVKEPGTYMFHSRKRIK